jgi:hypothetical protein
MSIMPMMNGAVKFFGLVAVLMSLCWHLPASAFGYLGHRLAGEVAEEYLCDEAQVQLEVLNSKYAFVTAGSWADKVRYRKEWSYSRPWHYINVDSNKFSAEIPRNSKGDVLTAIYRFRAELAATNLDIEQRRYAMLFLVHFVVDAHQPLHTGYKKDLGGNKIKVLLDNKKTSLHSVWDTGLLQYEDQSIEDYTAALLAQSVGQELAWLDSTPEDWVQESMDLRPLAYDYLRSANRDSLGLAELSETYLSDSKQVIDLRLAQAGVRLAGEMNRIWCSVKDTAQIEAVNHQISVHNLN